MSDIIFRAKLKQGEVEVEFEGSQEFVETHLNEWKQELDKKPISDPHSSTEAKRVEVPAGLSLSEYYKKLNPTTHTQTFAVFASFFDKQGKREMNPADFLKAYDEVRVQPPKNIHDSLQKAYSRQGYIIPGTSKGYWKLSLDGISAVENLFVSAGNKNE